MRDLASIEKIISLEPIKGKDKIELATILGWKVIVEKGQCAVGDLVVYVEYDTILPCKPEFEFLRSRCYSKLYDGFRIRNMKMAGHFSQGIVFTLSILPKKASSYKEGQVVAKELEIVKYDPEERRIAKQLMNSKPKGFKGFLCKFKFFRKILLNNQPKKIAYPDTVAKSSETNIQKIIGKLQHRDDTYYVTEKVEGQASTYLLDKKGNFKMFSHNVGVKDITSNWGRIATELEMEKLLKKAKKDTGLTLAIQGEIAGTGIQKNIYNFDGLRFFVYKITNVLTGEAFQYNELIKFVEEYGLELVPIIGLKKLDSLAVDEILSDANGQSVLGNCKREGLVYRSTTDQNVGFKARSPKYILWFEKNEVTE